jgi:hypothetical protein
MGLLRVLQVVHCKDSVCIAACRFEDQIPRGALRVTCDSHRQLITALRVITGRLHAPWPLGDAGALHMVTYDNGEKEGGEAQTRIVNIETGEAQPLSKDTDRG